MAITDFEMWLECVRRNKTMSSIRASTVTADYNIAEHQHIHVRAQEAVQSFSRIAHDRLILVKRSIAHQVRQRSHPGKQTTVIRVTSVSLGGEISGAARAHALSV